MTEHLEVWGDPIAHSRSPQLHRAAYEALGLDWAYDRRQVSEASFDRELAAGRDQVRGLSLTMPLKESAYRVARWRDPRAVRTGVANTLLMTDDGPRAWNTDIGGLVSAMRENGVREPVSARVVGTGATAGSAVVALAEVGVRDVEIVARSPHKAIEIADQAADFGLAVAVRALDDLRAVREVDVTVATLPGGTELPAGVGTAFAETGGALVDAAYAPWPTDLAAAFADAGREAASGLDMLLHQAVLQVRVFVTGQADDPLDGESAIVEAMRQAVRTA